MVVAAGAAVPCRGQETPKELTPERQAELLEPMKASVVRVAYVLKYDKGDAPEIGITKKWCPNCGTFHTVDSGEEYVTLERPVEEAGYVLDDRHIVTADLAINPRFVQTITVHLGEQQQPAVISRCGKRQCGVILEMAGPLAGAKALSFAEAGRAAYLMRYEPVSGQWSYTVKPLSLSLLQGQDGSKQLSGGGQGLVMDENGQAAGVMLNLFWPQEQSWLGTPAAWEYYSAAEHEQLLGKLTQWADGGLLRVKLNFRSPKTGRENLRRRYYGEDEKESVTEIDTLGAALAADKIAVLEELPPAVTARLERITVYLQDGTEAAGTFAGSFKDYGMFLATLDKAAAQPLPLYEGTPSSLQHRLLPSVQVLVQGNTRTVYVHHLRLEAFDRGWKNRLYPELGAPGRATAPFVFTPEGQLACLPVGKRRTVSQTERWLPDEEAIVCLASDLREPLEGEAAFLDKDNVPLSEEQENRLAWMGVMLQKLDRELARINNVSDLTSDGETGAMVSYVYENSPAATAGIAPGAILLRLHVPGEPKPLEIDLESERDYSGNFPWERLDEVPEEYFNQIPTPWQSADNMLNQALTKIGFDKPYQAEFFIDGKVVLKDFVTQESPAHYDSAPRFKSEPLGMTVKNITYEVRRYFQRPEIEPGVVVSRIEAGSKASVGGIKPFEIITHVNDQPIFTVEDFQKTTESGGELKLSIKRMLVGRVVTIKVEAASSSGEKDGSSEPPAEKAPAAAND